MKTKEIRCEFGDLIIADEINGIRFPNNQCACHQCRPGATSLLLDGDLTVIRGEGAELDEPYLDEVTEEWVQ